MPQNTKRACIQKQRDANQPICLKLPDASVRRLRALAALKGMSQGLLVSTLLERAAGNLESSAAATLG